MLSRLRTAVIGIVVLGGTVVPRAALAQAAATSASQPSAAKDPETAAPAPTASETKKPARRRRRPVSESVEKAVDEVMQRHYDPCAAAAQKGVPCFPSRVDVVGPRFSVAEAMRKYRPDGRRAEGAPITASDMRAQMGGAPLSASGGASVDPVCTVKSLIRRMSGTGKFYLYSLSDGRQRAAGAHRPQARPRRLREQSTGALRVPRRVLRRVRGDRRVAQGVARGRGPAARREQRPGGRARPRPRRIRSARRPSTTRSRSRSARPPPGGRLAAATDARASRTAAGLCFGPPERRGGTMSDEIRGRRDFMKLAAGGALALPALGGGSACAQGAPAGSAAAQPAGGYPKKPARKKALFVYGGWDGPRAREVPRPVRAVAAEDRLRRPRLRHPGRRTPTRRSWTRSTSSCRSGRWARSPRSRSTASSPR